MYKDKILECIQSISPKLRELTKYIYDNPELGLEEKLSSKAHVDLLLEAGFEVEYPYLGFETAFRATYDTGKPGRTVSFLSEYDALPEIGHACGHNLLGATTTGAGIVLSQVMDKGRVVVLGTPAEETDGVKVHMADANVFDDIDIALCTHPDSNWYSSGSSMAIEALEFKFHGKTAHAAAAPEEGVNALDAILTMFVSLNAMRQQMKSSARVHGIIRKAGVAANIIPDESIAEFFIRTEDMEYLNELRERLINCAKGAALATGCKMEFSNFLSTYYNLITNQTLSNHFDKTMEEVGVNVVERGEPIGSLDMGNVSHMVPSINPFFGMTNGEEIPAHTTEFRDCTITDVAHDEMKKAIYGLVSTAKDTIDSDELYKRIKEDFDNTIKIKK